MKWFHHTTIQRAGTAVGASGDAYPPQWFGRLLSRWFCEVYHQISFSLTFLNRCFWAAEICFVQRCTWEVQSHASHWIACHSCQFLLSKSYPIELSEEQQPIQSYSWHSRLLALWRVKYSILKQKESYNATYYIKTLRFTTNYVPRNRRRMPRNMWMKTPWSTWCNESRMYIWHMQNVDTNQNALKIRWHPAAERVFS